MSTSTNPAPILEVRDLRKHFPVRRGMLQRVTDVVRAVDDVSLSVPSGQTLGLVGESGCGKSTVARLILRLLDPDGGHIFYDGEDISRLSPAAIKPYRKKIQIVFQDPYGSLNPRMTIGGSIGEGLRATGWPYGKIRQRRIGELLDMVGLPTAYHDRYPHEFSGGQRQRIGIARALSVNPSLVICDEPVSALDVSIQAQIINLLKDLQGELGLSYLFISHDLNVVSYLCNHVCVMYRGQIVESAPTETLFDHPRHPYTGTLLDAIPSMTPDKAAVSNPPMRDACNGPKCDTGCVAAAHCREVGQRCAEDAPPLQEVAPGHMVRCWNPKDWG